MQRIERLAQTDAWKPPAAPSARSSAVSLPPRSEDRISVLLRPRPGTRPNDVAKTFCPQTSVGGTCAGPGKTNLSGHPLSFQSGCSWGSVS